MITLCTIWILVFITKEGLSAFSDMDFVMLCIVAHSIANEVAILIKGR